MSSTTTDPTPPHEPPPPAARRLSPLRSLLGIGSVADWLFKQVCATSACVVLVIVGLIVVLLTWLAWPAIRALGPGFLLSTDWAPNLDHFGALPFIYGSVVTSLLAMLLAVPLGVGTAAFLSEIATGWVRRGGSFMVELLAAIPSVVYGFWGVNFLAPAVQSLFNDLGGPNTGGKGLLSAGLILAIMIVPYVAAVAYDVCQAVPRAQREGALALGSTRWQTIWGVVLPYARPGIIGGCFLALGRAVGETMAVTMLIGNTAVIEMLPFGRGYTIPSVLALELPATSSEMHEAALVELGLILFGVTIVMNVLARLMIWRMGQTGRRPSRWKRLLGGPTPAVAVETAPRPAAVRPLPSNSGWAALVNNLMTAVLGGCLAVTCGPLFLIIGYITYRGAGALNLNFFTQLPKPLGEPGGGLANAMVGSAIIVGLATLMALPVGLLSAIFLAEFRTSRLAPVVRFVGELLNGVPSIVVGTFVYALVHVLITWGWVGKRNQFSGWAGAVALAIMMIPIVMRASEEAIKLVPRALRDASLALGSHQWQMVVRVTVPASLPAIITGVFLAVARIAGETAPLLLTAFGNDRWALSPNNQMGFLPLYIYRYSMSGDPIFEEQAWGAAFVLLAFVMALNVGIRFLTGKRVVSASRAGG